MMRKLFSIPTAFQLQRAIHQANPNQKLFAIRVCQRLARLFHIHSLSKLIIAPNHSEDLRKKKQNFESRMSKTSFLVLAKQDFPYQKTNRSHGRSYGSDVRSTGASPEMEG